MRTPLLRRLYGPTVVGLFERVKKAFDPGGIFNPGVIAGGLDDAPMPGFKFGDRAPAIPPEIEKQLRIIERTGAWGVAKSGLVK